MGVVYTINCIYMHTIEMSFLTIKDFDYPTKAILSKGSLDPADHDAPPPIEFAFTNFKSTNHLP